MGIYAENMSPSNYTVEQGKIFPMPFIDISRMSYAFVLSLPVKRHIFLNTDIQSVTVGTVGLHTELVRWFSKV